MTDTTDTRAALDAAIDEWIRLRGLSYLTGGAQAAQTARGQVDTAITAHVEAEVARRLAVAPSVDDALAAYGTAVYELGYVLHRPDRDAVLRPVKDAAEATLRAAIAADRERAVREATDGAVQGERFAAEICRLVGARETGTGGQQVTAGPLYANAAKRIDRMIARDKARPTPDEARRLVDAHGDSIRRVERAAARRVSDAAGEPVTEQMVTAQIDTRAALLRALGVEERAVREATEPPRITSTTGVVPVVADADGRMLGGRREGRDTVYDQIKVPVARDKARPTPDEARRLVGEFAGAHGAMVAHLAGLTGPESGEDVAARVESTRAALLRALGVEERAVREATDGAVQGERFAAEICRLVGARETGTGGQQVTTGPLYANAAKRIDRMIARDKARPTPDEAHRMINELIGAMAVVGNGLGSDPGTVVAKRIAADARAAILRALGVEA